MSSALPASTNSASPAAPAAFSSPGEKPPAAVARAWPRQPRSSPAPRTSSISPSTATPSTYRTMPTIPTGAPIAGQTSPSEAWSAIATGPSAIRLAATAATPAGKATLAPR